MSEFILTIPGEPTAKGRPRVFHGHGVTPKRTMLAENRISELFTTEYPDATPFTGHVTIYCVFWMSRQGRPDWDNLAKLATDALNGLAYKDDAQIVDAHVTKIMPDPRVHGAKPGTWRNRKNGDPLTYDGHEYHPHTTIIITETAS